MKQALQIDDLGIFDKPKYIQIELPDELVHKSVFSKSMMTTNSKLQESPDIKLSKRNSQTYVTEHISLPTLSIRERNFRSSMATYETERKSYLKVSDY